MVTSPDGPNDCNNRNNKKKTTRDARTKLKFREGHGPKGEGDNSTLKQGDLRVVRSLNSSAGRYRITS